MKLLYTYLFDKTPRLPCDLDLFVMDRHGRSSNGPLINVTKKRSFGYRPTIVFSPYLW